MQTEQQTATRSGAFLALAATGTAFANLYAVPYSGAAHPEPAIERLIRSAAQSHSATFSRAPIDFYVAKLAEDWVRATMNMSSPRQMMQHRLFSVIESIGMDAAPALLRSYTKPSPLFLILQAITGENPVPKSDYGDMEAIRRAWIKRGQELCQLS